MKKILLLIIVVFISCQDNKVRISGSKNIEQADQFYLKFPDTIRKKTWTNGKLIYEFEKDSLKIGKRYLFFYVVINRNNVDMGLNEIQNQEKHLVFADTLTNNEKDSLTFETGADFQGENYLHAVIEDVRLTNNSSQDSLFYKVTEKTIITKPIYVLEN